MANLQSRLEKYTAEHEMLKEQLSRAKEVINPLQKRYTQCKKNIAKVRVLMREEGE